MLETLIMTTVILSGATLVYAFGIKSWAMIPLGCIVGLSLIILIGLAQYLLGLPTTPRIALTLIGLTALVYWTCWLIQNLRHKRLSRKQVVLLALVPLGVLIAVACIYKGVIPFTYFRHVDSMEYLAIGQMLEAGTLGEGVSLFQLQKRMFGVPLLHAIANTYGNLYLPSATPLLALSSIGVLVWLWVSAVPRNISKKLLFATVAVCVLMLISTTQFVLHATYVNGHLLFGILLLLFIGCTWLVATNAKQVPGSALLMLSAIAMATMLVTRPEAFILLGVAIVPIVISRQLTANYKKVVLSVYGATVLVWHALLAYLHIRSGARSWLIFGEEGVRTLELSIWAPILLGIIALGLVPLVSVLYKLPGVLVSKIPTMVEVLLWSILTGLLMYKPDTLVNSISATITNIVEVWGLAWILITTLLIGVMIFIKIPQNTILRYAITTFIPVVFMLTYLRDGAYRVGGGDSLVRMWVQILPLAVFYIGLSVLAGTARVRNGRRPHSK